jgi:hypothetical protein
MMVESQGLEHDFGRACRWLLAARLVSWNQSCPPFSPKVLPLDLRLPVSLPRTHAIRSTLRPVLLSIFTLSYVFNPQSGYSNALSLEPSRLSLACGADIPRQTCTCPSGCALPCLLHVLCLV